MIYLNETISSRNQEYDECRLCIDNWCKRKSQQEIVDVILGEYKNVKVIYETFRLKKYIENKLKLILNHKLIRKYKRILGLETIYWRNKKIHSLLYQWMYWKK